jgi:hypothetical protein
MEVVMDGSHLVAETAHLRGTSGQVEGELRRDWPTDEREFNVWAVSPSGARDQGLPANRHRVTLVVKLAKIIGLALVLVAAILAFDLLVLWIASARVIERMPF